MIGHKAKNPKEADLFFLSFSGDSSWGYTCNLFCGWKQGLSRGDKLGEKWSVKQTTVVSENENKQTNKNKQQNKIKQK